MTQTGAEPQGQRAQEHAPEPPHIIPRPHSDAAALRAIEHAKEDLHERAEHIRAAPQDHKPKLVLSDHVRGTSLLDKIADAVNKVCGSMWVFLFVTIGIVAWLFLGNIVGFDKTPWPLLQVSANRAQAAFAAHDMPGRQRQIQDSVNEILAVVAPDQG